MRRRGIALAALLAASTLTHVAAADDDAEALFVEGRALLDAGDLEAACAKLADSQRLEPKLPKLAFLAVCHDRQGKTATAWAEYHEVADAAASAGLVEREAKARELLAKLEPRLSMVKLEIPAAIAGLDVACDGVALGDAARGAPFPLDPGEHLIVISAPGHIAWSTTVRIEGEGTQTVIAVPSLAPAPAAVVPAPTALAPTAIPVEPVASARPGPDRLGTEPSNVPVYVLGGVGIAGLAVGSYFGIRTFTKRGESDDACVGGCTQEGVDLNDDAMASSYVSTAAFAVGFAGLGIATVLVLTRPSPESAATARLAATVGPSGVGLRGAW